jgi:hypothetical protein
MTTTIPSNNPQRDAQGQVAFALGTGRCGTTFIYRVLALEPEVAAWHERHRFADAFHRYCQWYGLPVDHAGFLATKEVGIRDDLCTHAISFESSAYLSFDVLELYERFKARFLLLIRRPDLVVNSYVTKGWYTEPLHRNNVALAPGYQPDFKHAHHPFSRILPTGSEAEKWGHYTQVGKLAWYWRIVNAKVMDLFDQLPSTHWRIIRLEELSYSTYLSIADFIGFEPAVSEQQYSALVSERPNRVEPARAVQDWSEQEIAEFEAEVGGLAEKLGYVWRVGELTTLTSRP